ncbi:MAG: hypothetical protein ICV60_02880, partial [Pyrinomonadaceae bacterium]|nr:hypothetical protein [Pyrinomonadaceae bacterium]
MNTAIRPTITFILILVLCGATFAQEQTGAASPVVTATATAGKVRYVSMGEVQQTRVQVFSSDGILVFDSSYRDGNLIDWQLTDQQGARVKDGSYIFLVTVKDFSGRSTQKYGTTIVEREQVYLEQTQRASLSQAQMTALESSREGEALSPIDRMGVAELNRAASATTTNGNAATVTQSASTVEQSSATNPSAEAAGTGSQNSIAKWTDNAGTLGDSSIYETNGKIGIGTTTPREGLTVYSPTGTAKYIMSEWGGGGSVSFGGDNSNGPFLLSHTDSEGKATGNYTASRIRFGASGFLFDTSPVTP